MHMKACTYSHTRNDQAGGRSLEEREISLALTHIHTYIQPRESRQSVKTVYMGECIRHTTDCTGREVLQLCRHTYMTRIPRKTRHMSCLWKTPLTDFQVRTRPLVAFPTNSQPLTYKGREKNCGPNRHWQANSQKTSDKRPQTGRRGGSRAQARQQRVDVYDPHVADHALDVLQSDMHLQPLV